MQTILKTMLPKLVLCSFICGSLAQAATIATDSSPCFQSATTEAQSVTGDKEDFIALVGSKMTAATGVIHQYIFFTKINYKVCAKLIQKGNYDCNSAIVDVLEQTEVIPSQCKIIDSDMGDGNG